MTATDYNEFIDNALKMNEAAILQEKQLVGQSSYLLNNSGTKWLVVGLSPAAGYIPIIQIRSASAHIFFTLDEWREFSKTGGSSPNHQMEVSVYKDIQLMCLKSRNQQITLSQDTYNNIFNMMDLINQQLSVLNSCDFVRFYKSTLRACSQLGGDLCQNIKSILSCHENTLNALYMFEVLYLHYNNLYFDLEGMKLSD